MTQPLIHPGEILREEFLKPMGLSAIALAKLCHVPRTRIERIVNEKTPISADTALRLGRYFGIEAEFWLRLQARYDLGVAEKSMHDIHTISSRAVKAISEATLQAIAMSKMDAKHEHLNALLD